MARTYAAVEVDKDAQPRGWRLVLCTFQEVKLYRKLRKGGLFGGFGSVDELKARCLQLATLPITIEASQNEKLVEKPEDPWHELASCAVATSENLNCRKELADVRFASDQLLCRNGEECFVASTATVGQMCYSQCMKQTVELEMTDSNIEHSVLMTMASHQDVKANPRMLQLIPPRQCSSQENVAFSHGTTSLDLCHPVSDPEPITTLETLNGEGGSGLFFVGEMSESLVRHPCLGTGVSSGFDGNCNAKSCQIYNVDCNKMQISCKLKPGEQGRNELESRVSDLVESDGDSDSKSIHFKRMRKQCVTEGLSDADNTAVSALLNRSQTGATDQSMTGRWERFDVNIYRSEPLILKRAGKLCKRKHEPHDVTNHGLVCLPISQSIDADMDHETLGSRMHKLIAQKEVFASEEVDISLERVLHAEKQASAHMLNNCSSHIADVILDIDKDGIRDCGVGLTQQKHLLDRKVSQISCGCSERHISVVPEFTIAEDCDLQVHETCNDGFAEEDIKCMVRNLIKTSQQYVQAQHKHSERNSVTTSLLPAVTKLRSIIPAACVALRILDGGGSFMEAEQICPKQLLREFERNMAQLGTYDVNQYFPSVNKKMEVAEKINCYVQDGDTLVVVSGWENDFFMHVKERLSRSGKRCDYISYILSETNKVAALKEWFKKEKEDMPTGSNLVVCVSPHFELCGQNVDVLFELVLELKAKLLALILPFTAERLKRERSYDLIWEDKHFLQGEVLWPWGLMDFPESSFNHRNGISPSMYLWSRSDWTVKHRQVACQFGHIPKQTLESKNEFDRLLMGGNFSKISMPEKNVANLESLEKNMVNG